VPDDSLGIAKRHFCFASGPFPQALRLVHAFMPATVQRVVRITESIVRHDAKARSETGCTRDRRNKANPAKCKNPARVRN
jgi:hypothetical protein